jgi:hypothetical protein
MRCGREGLVCADAEIFDSGQEVDEESSEDVADAYEALQAT